MYTSREKVGRIIAVWSDAVGMGNNSTTAALIASQLASQKPASKKILMLSTDKGPYDGVSLLNPMIQDNAMDDLILLAAIGGLKSEQDFNPYVFRAGDHLDVLKCSNDFNRLSTDSITAYRNILSFAATIYDYVIVDIYGGLLPMSSAILRDSDLVILCVSQNPKHLDTIINDEVLTKNEMLQDKSAVVVITDYKPMEHFDLKELEKMLGWKGLLTISESYGVNAAASRRNLLFFVESGYSGKKGFASIFSKNKVKDTDSTLSEELSTIVDIIVQETSQEDAEYGE